MGLFGFAFGIVTAPFSLYLSMRDRWRNWRGTDVPGPLDDEEKP